MTAFVAIKTSKFEHLLKPNKFFHPRKALSEDLDQRELIQFGIFFKH